MPTQRIVVFQQNGSGEKKIRAVRDHGRELRIVQVVSIDEVLPQLIDEPEPLLPSHQSADLVLDYLRHPDLSAALAERCVRQQLPMVASGKRHNLPGVFNPPTCCGLGRSSDLGAYGRQFGAPELWADLKDGVLVDVGYRREAPCACTRQAVQAILGLSVEEAVTRFGLAVQTCCTADSSSWDPIHGTSPIHYAGHIHAQALKKACRRP